MELTQRIFFPLKKRAKWQRNPRRSPASRPAATGVEGPAWPAFEVERWAIDRLKPYANNARQHSAKQLEQIRGAMRSYGWTTPILAREDGTIIAGHARWEAGKLEGFTEVPVIVARGWTDEQCRAYTLADNRIALNGAWDEDVLKLELGELSALGIDLEPLGFELAELGKLLGSKEGLTDPDDVPEPPAQPVSRLGDLWILGKHRLLCGDSTKAEDVTRLMGGQKADLIITDPPYGVDFERGKYVSREKAAKGPDYAPIANDELKGDELTEFVQSALAQAFEASKDASIYVWCTCLDEGAMLASVRGAGFKVQSQIVWRKTPFVIGRAGYHWQHENCWYGFKKTGHPWYGGRDKCTVWDCPKPQKCDLHPTMKPVALYATAIANSSKAGDIVLDVFAGAGPLAIACEQSGRSAYMMELAPVYCDVIIRRWSEFVGGAKATLDADGRDFETIAAERVKVAA
jgi:DNA modification methylase